MHTDLTTPAPLTLAQLPIRVCPDEYRMDFLPKNFGPQLMLVIENTTYKLANKNLKLVDRAGACKPYTGGYWEYATTNASDAPFLFLKTSGEVMLTNPVNGEEVTLSPGIAGIVLTMMTLQAVFSADFWDDLSEQRQDRLIDNWQNLRSDGYDLAKATGYEQAFHRMID